MDNWMKRSPPHHVVEVFLCEKADCMYELAFLWECAGEGSLICIRHIADQVDLNSYRPF
jgi:hypothetical protein